MLDLRVTYGTFDHSVTGVTFHHQASRVTFDPHATGLTLDPHATGVTFVPRVTGVQLCVVSVRHPGQYRLPALPAGRGRPEVGHDVLQALVASDAGLSLLPLHEGLYGRRRGPHERDQLRQRTREPPGHRHRCLHRHVRNDQQDCAG